LVVAVATGRDWAGHTVTKTNVVFVALEGQIGLRARVQALEHDRGIESQEGIHYVFEPFNIANEDDVNALAMTALLHKAKFIVIDTLSASTAGTVDENSNSAMAGMIAYIQRLAKMVGAAVLIVHHTGNDATRGERGAYALRANPDVSIEVALSGEDRYWRCVKSRDGTPHVSGMFRIEPITFQPEHEDEPLESIIVRHVEGAKAPSPSKSKTTERADEALKAIKVYLGMNSAVASDQFAPDEATESDIIKVVKEAFASYSSSHRAEYVRDAISALINSGHLIREGGNLRLLRR
jgi:hypothetical protein